MWRARLGEMADQVRKAFIIDGFHNEKHKAHKSTPSTYVALLKHMPLIPFSPTTCSQS